MKRLIAAFALTAALGAWAVPTVTITKVQQDYPWSDVVGVDYTVEIPDGDTAEGCSLKFYATINDAVAEVSVSKKSADDPDLLAAGTHTVYWTPAKNVKDTAAGLAAQVVKDGEPATPMTVAELYAIVQANAEATYTKESADAAFQAKGDYLTEHQDVSGKLDVATAAETYATKTELAAKAEASTVNTLTTSMTTLSTSLNSVKSTADAALPATTAAETYATKTELAAKANRADVYTRTAADTAFQPKGDYLTEHQDISGKLDAATAAETYATKTELADKADASALSAYATTESVDTALGAKANADVVTALSTTVDGKADSSALLELSNNLTANYETAVAAGNKYATKTELADKADGDDVYTKAAADEKFLTEHQSLEDYATTEQVTTAIEEAVKGKLDEADLADYAKTADVEETYLAKADAADAYQPRGSYLTSESDPAWAAAKSSYSTTAQMNTAIVAATNDLMTKATAKFQTAGSYVPTTRKVAGKALGDDITLTASDVGALASTVTALKNPNALTLSSGRAYDGSAAMSLTAADITALGIPTTATLNAATNALATAASKTDKYAAATRTANLASSTHQYMIVDMTATNSYTVSYKAFGTVAEACQFFNTNVAYKSTHMAFRYIPAGTYVVGNTDGSNYAQTFCTMPRGYYIGIYPVTVAQWARVMACVTTSTSYLPASNTQNGYAVNYVNMRGTGAITNAPGLAVDSKPSFCSNFVARTKLSGFDLPTDMMWEVAARAGTDTTWFFGTTADFLNSYCRSKNNGAALSVVGAYLPNQWGLYDMYGNVWERCRDYYTSDHPDTSGQAADGQTPYSGTAGTSAASPKTYHNHTVATRGGAYNFDGNNCRSSNRAGSSPSVDNTTYIELTKGFRLSRIVP